MKLYFILIFINFCRIVDCSAQSQGKSLSSIESSLEKIEKNIKIPCQYFVKFHHRENGKSFFTTNDSCQLEFDFFTTNKLPFFNSNQTSAETITSYINWLRKETDLLKDIRFSKIDENTEDGYCVYKIQDALGEYYRLLAREGNILISIKIIDKKMDVENQLERLQILYALNKD